MINSKVSLRRFLFLLFFFPFHSPELQIQVLNERFQFVVVFWIDVPCGFEEGNAVFLDWFSHWLRLVADEPVGDVDVILQVFRCRVLL